MKKTLYVHTLGCKVNSYETMAIATELKTKGYELVSKANDAAVIIVNTCSVTKTAEQKSRQHISSYRKGNPEAVLLVMGCYAQSHAEEAASLGADIVLGTSNRGKAVEYIDSFLSNGVPIIDVKKTVRFEHYEELGVVSYSENARAYLKIQDGCNNFCSYCYIPYTRGNSRSRDPRVVVDEAKALVEAGYQEIIITGIHIGTYGKDLADGSFALADLLEAILKKCSTLPRLRISSIEESEIDDRLFAVIQRYPQIVDHLHIPLQSGSKTVLERMRRKYDTDAFLAKMEKLRQIHPNIALTTEIIVGYPEETEEEWAETLEFCKKAQFAEIHVFPFSPRPGTTAAQRPDTKPEIKKRRVHELMALSKELREAYKARFYGQEMEVLFENYDAKNKLAYGHTSNYLMVKIPSEVPLHGQWKKIVYESSIAAD